MQLDCTFLCNEPQHKNCCNARISSRLYAENAKLDCCTRVSFQQVWVYADNAECQGRCLLGSKSKSPHAVLQASKVPNNPLRSVQNWETFPPFDICLGFRKCLTLHQVFNWIWQNFFNYICAAQSFVAGVIFNRAEQLATTAAKDLLPKRISQEKALYRSFSLKITCSESLQSSLLARSLVWTSCRKQMSHMLHLTI